MADTRNLGPKRERPIIFSGAMVRAILEGRKAQTRRVVKPQPIVESDGRMHWNGIGWTTHHDRLTGLGGTMLTKCPFGRPGDRLWVRETFASPVASWTDYGWEWDEDDGARLPGGKPVPGNQFSKRTAKYRADYSDWHQDEGPWRPPIHMPRWASRITLEVTDVRIERLHSLAEEDAQAEGVSPAETTDGDLSYALGFIDLWDSLNAKRGHSWASNPWVWVVTFRRLEEARS
jgi:hypothetical protein